jgi:tetratricopeptide (TPR) repeat protein
MDGNGGSKDTKPAKGVTVPEASSAVAAPAAGSQTNPLNSDSGQVAAATGGNKSQKRSTPLTRFRHGLKALTEIVGNLGKLLAILVPVFLLARVGYRAVQNRSVQIGAIVVPKDLEERGYTSRTVGERLRYEMHQIVQQAQTSAGKEQFALAAESELPDIEVPKTDISFHSVVLFLQDAFGLQPPQVTGEITQDKGSDGLIATVSIRHSGRAASAPLFERTALQPDPKALIAEMAQKALELVDPYVLAVQAYDNHDLNKTADFIQECDGDFAKLGCNLWGRVLLDEKNFNDAIENFEKAAEIDPKFAGAFINWGGALLIKPDPDYDGAIENFVKATGLDPKSTIANYDWGVALTAKPRPDYAGAIEKFKKAAEIDPKFAAAYMNWGAALVKKPDPDYDDAIEKFKKAIEINHKFKNAYIAWGLALVGKPDPDYDGAIEKFKKTIDLDPEYALAYKNLDDAVSKEKHPPDAVAKFMTMVKSAPNDWTAHYILGLLEIKAGDTKSGIIELQRADKLQPGNQFILAALQKASK